jgi:hypothetical protein
MSNNAMHEKDDQLYTLIQQMAEQHRPDLPSAGVIWWRAQILRKLEEKKRIERPMVFMRALASTICVAVMAYLLFVDPGVFVSGNPLVVALVSFSLFPIGVLVIYLVASLREARS